MNLNSTVSRDAIYLGVVEDNSDPQFRGRLKVRVHIIHGDSNSGLPTTALPWAIPSNETLPGEYPIGTIVVVSFVNQSIDSPIYFGYLTKVFNKSQCIQCNNYFAPKRCEAFPDGIPDEIYFNKFIHTQPYTNGSVTDNNILFEPKT